MDKKLTHGGKRKGAGRKPGEYQPFVKKLRASDIEWREFMSLLTHDARKDFLLLFNALRKSR
jgi:hypothetical protein